MRLKRWDWDAQNFIEEDYPDEMFRPFLNWLFTTKMWIEQPDLVNGKVLQLQRAMAEHRNPPETHHEPPDAPTEAVLSPTEKRLANLAKARAVRAAKKAAREAVPV